jgi:hypothetical protein
MVGVGGELCNVAVDSLFLRLGCQHELLLAVRVSVAVTDTTGTYRCTYRVRACCCLLRMKPKLL